MGRRPHISLQPKAGFRWNIDLQKSINGNFHHLMIDWRSLTEEKTTLSRDQKVLQSCSNIFRDFLVTSKKRFPIWTSGSERLELLVFTWPSLAPCQHTTRPHPPAFFISRGWMSSLLSKDGVTGRGLVSLNAHSLLHIS